MLDVAKLRVHGDELVVGLSPLEKLGAFRGDVHVPLAAVRSARVSARPWSELRGIRAPGTGFPGIISLCTRRGSGVVDFAAVYRGGPAVVVDLEGAHFDRIVVTCEDADNVVRRIEQAVPPRA
jgi:hypothetical protein